MAAPGTIVVICVDETLEKIAAAPLKSTSVTPSRFVPVIVTPVPGGPDVGENDVIVGRQLVAFTSKLEPVAVPTPVTTWTAPSVAPTGTVVLILVDETKSSTAFVPLKSASVVPSSSAKRFVPLIVTPHPSGPDVGAKDEIVGAQPPGLDTVKLDELVAVPSRFVAWMTPVVPAATVARSWVEETMVKEVAAVPPKSTAVTAGLVKFVPLMVTTHPAGPLVGVNDVIVGAAASAGVAKPATSNTTTATNPAARPPYRPNRPMTATSPPYPWHATPRH